MNGFEINKIVAAIIFTVLVVFGIEKITDLIFYVKKPSKIKKMKLRLQNCSSWSISHS